MKNFLIGISLILLLTSCVKQRFVVNSPAESPTTRSKTEYYDGGSGRTHHYGDGYIAHPPRETGDPVIPIEKRNLANECNGIDNVNYIEHKAANPPPIIGILAHITLPMLLLSYETTIVCN